MIFDKIYPILKGSRAQELSTTFGKGFSPLAVSGVSTVNKALLCLYMIHEYPKRQMLIICEDEAQARRICADINTLAPDTAEHYPAKDITLTRVESMSREYEHERIRVMTDLYTGKTKIITASMEAVMQRTLPHEAFRAFVSTIRKGDKLDTRAFAGKLSEMGYSRVDEVTSPSQFAVRGDIFDIYSVCEAGPVRMELWDDEIDCISSYDPATQRRTDPKDSFVIAPALEVFCKREELAVKIEHFSKKVSGKRADLVKQELARDHDLLCSGITPANIDKYLPLVFDAPEFITEHLTEPMIVIAEYNNAAQKAKSVFSQYNEDLRILLEQGELYKGLDGYVENPSALINHLIGYSTIFMDSFMRTNPVPVKRLFTFNANRTSPWGGEMRQLEEDVRSLTDNDYAVIVLAGSDKTIPIIEKDMTDDGFSCEIMGNDTVISKGRVALATGALSSGFELPTLKLSLITQAKALSAKRRQSHKNAGEEIKSLADITPGDLVVHSLHGIGRFQGIKKLELDGIVKDYITIQYAGTDMLFVPVTQMDLVSRYIGPHDEGGVKLNKLSSNEWQRTRSKAKKAVKDMAAELIALYAKRRATPGFAFSADSEWQKDFENRFDYVETDDQLKCTTEIKHDMERSSPMDRLLCGDVGFGKTEVAFRAAFKCMLDGKQCAILVPTTVLAWQHYQSAIKRFEHFPFTIELLSRFRTRKEQQEVLKKLAVGSVDMVIGTHRLVQKDIVFKDLGLAIIDEEQRFGVRHKEKFKESFAGIDVLTLSATPIPRTLNMAMSGIRDMSVIEEPPVDRYPVQTYVTEFDYGTIVQAIERELRRGGQVYYIHNRVETIDMCAAKLAQLLPEDVRIATAHGQMSEDRLSDIWTSLVEHEIDILICTTIIETGVDVPNVNTLIIEESDRFGLSQLYQLRGRVGRSNKRAFAYFTFKGGKVLSEIATKRLDAIREFTQFGSGFRVAMRDLEIRGAGSILGGSQHGHMEAVGYDMYIQMLNQAIAEQKGEPLPPSPEDCLIDLQIDAHIPEDYISALPSRLDVYRKVAAVKNEKGESDLIDELIDRYGEPPRAILGLIKVSLTRNRASKLGIKEIAQRGEYLYIYTSSVTIEQAQALSREYFGRVTVFDSDARPHLRLRILKTEQPSQVMENSIKVMEQATVRSDAP